MYVYIYIFIYIYLFIYIYIHKHMSDPRSVSVPPEGGNDPGGATT